MARFANELDLQFNRLPSEIAETQSLLYACRRLRTIESPPAPSHLAFRTLLIRAADVEKLMLTGNMGGWSKVRCPRYLAIGAAHTPMRKEYKALPARPSFQSFPP